MGAPHARLPPSPSRLRPSARWRPVGSSHHHVYAQDCPACQRRLYPCVLAAGSPNGPETRSHMPTAGVSCRSATSASEVLRRLGDFRRAAARTGCSRPSTQGSARAGATHEGGLRPGVVTRTDDRGQRLRISREVCVRVGSSSGYHEYTCTDSEHGSRSTNYFWVRYERSLTCRSPNGRGRPFSGEPDSIGEI